MKNTQTIHDIREYPQSRQSGQLMQTTVFKTGTSRDLEIMA